MVTHSLLTPTVRVQFLARDTLVVDLSFHRVGKLSRLPVSAGMVVVGVYSTIRRWSKLVNKVKLQQTYLACNRMDAIAR